jgi:hypothetical protein
MASSFAKGGEPIMAKDPVCGMEVDEQRAARQNEHQGRVPTISARRAASSASLSDVMAPM